MPNFEGKFSRYIHRGQLLVSGPKNNKKRNTIILPDGSRGHEYNFRSNDIERARNNLIATRLLKDFIHISETVQDVGTGKSFSIDPTYPKKQLRVWDFRQRFPIQFKECSAEVAVVALILNERDRALNHDIEINAPGHTNPFPHNLKLASDGTFTQYDFETVTFSSSMRIKKNLLSIWGVFDIEVEAFFHNKLRALKDFYSTEDGKKFFYKILETTGYRKEHRQLQGKSSKEFQEEYDAFVGNIDYYLNL